MAVKLNRTAFDFAKELIVAGRFVFDERDAWSEHRPSEDEFLAAHVSFRGGARRHMNVNVGLFKSTRLDSKRPGTILDNAERGLGAIPASPRQDGR
jgi:hypothetical protein